MIERTYLFNPFLLQTASDEELSQTINELASMYKFSDVLCDVVFNINLEADLLMIYSEFIARLTESSSLKKLDCDNKEAETLYEIRTEWTKTHDEKAPNIDYFKSMASKVVEEDRRKQLKDEGMLTRFKNCYKSLESKQNALKDKLKAMRYEEGV